MSKLVKIRSLAWFLGGWLGVVAILFPQGVVLCISEAAHVELEMLGDACCDKGRDHKDVSAGMVEDYSTDAGTDCSHVQVTNWHHHSNQLQGKATGQQMALCAVASTLGVSGESTVGSKPVLDTPIPPLLLEHLSTSILIC